MSMTAHILSVIMYICRIDRHYRHSINVHRYIVNVLDNEWWIRNSQEKANRQ